MTISERMAKSVKSLIEKVGTSVTFRRSVAGEYNPNTSSSTLGSNDDETIKAAFLNYTDNELANTHIRRDDRKVLMSAYQSDGTALTKTPQTGDQLVGEGDTVRIESVQTIKSGSTTIGYILQARL
jgi:hypothetical protein